MRDVDLHIKEASHYETPDLCEYENRLLSLQFCHRLSIFSNIYSQIVSIEGSNSYFKASALVFTRLSVNVPFTTQNSASQPAGPTSLFQSLE